MHPIIEKLCDSKQWALRGNTIEVLLDSGRSQLVVADAYESRGIAYLRLYSPLGPANAIDERRLRAALRMNWTLPHGAISIASLGDEGEHLVLSDSFPADRATLDDLVTTVEYLASIADDYEKHVFGTDTY